VNHFTLFVDDHHGTGEQTGQRTFRDFNPVIRAERGVSERGRGNYPFNALRRAKTSMGKGKIFGNGQHGGVGYVGG